MTALLILITVVFAGLCALNSRLGFLLLAASLPAYLLRLDLFGIPSTLLELFISAFILIWLIQNRHELEKLFQLPKWLGLSLVLFLVAGIVGSLTSPDTTAALGIFKAYLIEPMALFLILNLELKRGSIQAQSVFTALGITALVLAVIACIQWITSTGIPVPWDIERRVTSLFDYPNALGLFLGPIVVIAVAQIYQNTKRRLWLSVLIPSSIAIVLAQSEAAVVAVLATLVLAGLALPRIRKVTASLLLVAIVAVCLSLWRTFVFEKLTLQDYSGGVRLSQWSETIDMLKDNWLFGAGLSGYPIMLEPYHNATHFEIFQYPHNVFLNIWTELGLLGLIAFALLIAVVLKPLYSRRLTTTNTIALLVLVEMFIHGLVDVPYFKNDLAVFTWIIIAIALTYARKSPHQKEC